MRPAIVERMLAASWEARMERLLEEIDTARAAGDAERVARLDALLRAEARAGGRALEPRQRDAVFARLIEALKALADATLSEREGRRAQEEGALAYIRVDRRSR
ncbi:MAG: hypothetical protein AAFM92_09920 [Pseudomonadota bacterium]